MFKQPMTHDGPTIVAHGLTKRYGRATVVDELSFEVRPGRVTGFLGPNGAGKTQTIKMILGSPTSDPSTISRSHHEHHRHHREQARAPHR
ncbi:MAG TPA: ATP-binding cassette domain-containing protein [Solirubrobacteraceae bacterium]